MSAPFHTKVAAVSAVVFAASLLVVGSLPAVQGNAAPLAFTAPFAVVSVVLAGLAWKRGRWAALLLVVWAAVNLLFHFPILVHGLGWLDSFFDFGVVVPVFAGLAAALVAGTVSFIQQRRHGPNGVQRPRAMGVGRCRGAGRRADGGVGRRPSRRDRIGGRGRERAGAVRLEMKGARFEPVDLRASAGEPVRLAIRNRDFVAHRFSVEPLGIDLAFIPGTEKIVELPAMDTGTYLYVCTIDGHEEMAGFILVR